MKSKISNTNNSLACTMLSDSSFRFTTSVPCEFEADTVAYAACRFVRHNADLRDQLIRQAVHLGLRRGREARPICRRLCFPAASLSLPGLWAQLDLTVSQGTVTVAGVHLS